MLNPIAVYAVNEHHFTSSRIHNKKPHTRLYRLISRSKEKVSSTHCTRKERVNEFPIFYSIFNIKLLSGQMEEMNFLRDGTAAGLWTWLYAEQGFWAEGSSDE